MMTSMKTSTYSVGTNVFLFLSWGCIFVPAVNKQSNSNSSKSNRRHEDKTKMSSEDGKAKTKKTVRFYNCRRKMIGWSIRSRRRVPAAAQGLPRSSAGAGLTRSQGAEPAGADGGVGPPSEGWAALSGEREEERRRSRDGGEPAGDTHSSINPSINPSISKHSDWTASASELNEISNRKLFSWSPLPASYLSGRAALFGRIHQELVEQVDGLRGRVGDDLLQWDRWILLKGDFIVVRQLYDLLETRRTWTLWHHRARGGVTEEDSGFKKRVWTNLHFFFTTWY